MLGQQRIAAEIEHSSRDSCSSRELSLLPFVKISYPIQQVVRTEACNLDSVLVVNLKLVNWIMF